jgi:uncharacterized DUF497 family protein
MIRFDNAVAAKLLEKHNITTKEVVECFANSEGIYLIDETEDHKTDPPTFWFMAPTNHNRMLKVCFVRRGVDVDIKTAFEPTSDKHLELYGQSAGLSSCWPLEE